jgi:hypothetical protein
VEESDDTSTEKAKDLTVVFVFIKRSPIACMGSSTNSRFFADAFCGGMMSLRSEKIYNTKVIL